MSYIPTHNLSQAKDRAGKSQSFIASSGMQVGKVISIDRKKHTVDVVLQSGETLRKVLVSSSVFSTRSGYNYITKFSNPESSSIPQKEQGNFVEDKLRTVYCLVEFAKDDLSSPIVIGFLMPETNQMSFDREGFSIDRHETDQYSMTETDQQSVYDKTTDTKLSNFEWVHPSGFWVRVGRGTVHEDLTTKDSQKLARFRGTANANTPAGTPGPNSEDFVPITMQHPSGTQIIIDTLGNIAITTSPDGLVTINGCAVITECNLLEVLNDGIIDHEDNFLINQGGHSIIVHMG